MHYNHLFIIENNIEQCCKIFYGILKCGNILVYLSLFVKIILTEITLTTFATVLQIKSITDCIS